MRRPPFEIVLRHLRAGRELTLKNGLILGMDENNKLCHKMTQVEGDHSEDVWLLLDVPFNAFVDWCAEFSFDELFLMGAETALQGMKI